MKSQPRVAAGGCRNPAPADVAPSRLPDHDDAAARPPLRMTICTDGPVLVIDLQGALDAESCYRPLEALASVCECSDLLSRIVLDVTRAQVGDFAVTGLLRRMAEQARSAGALFELRGASRELAMLVGLSGLSIDVQLS